ncbi:MAG: S-layer homology domain-containing protein [Clostridia bacterium]|nr:S-layer homology domain-containing protein [Clostridia bacterium]
MKRIKLPAYVLALSFIFALAAPVFPAGSSEFSDVKTTRWSHDAIRYAVDEGYMNGVGNGKFDPAGSMTRGMFVTVLWRKEGSPEVGFRPDFTDVKTGKYYSKAVIWAKDHGIVSGVTDTKFDPNGKITREQLATMLYRYCSVKNLVVDERGDVSAFADKSKIHSYAADAMSWAVGKKLIGGVTKDTLVPRGYATREQVATILKRFDETEFTTLADFYREKANKIADYAEQMLWEALDKRKADPGFNPTGCMEGTIVLGLAELGRFDFLAEYVDAWMELGDELRPTEPALFATVVLLLYEKTGDEKYADACRVLKEKLDTWPCDTYGELKYTYELMNNEIYVDGTGVMTPFLARYGRLFGDGEAEARALLQVDNYLKYGVDPARKLVNHGYTTGGAGRGEMGWGRGTGWLMLAVGGVMEDCPDDSVCAACDALIKNTFRYLSPDNTFSWSLAERDGPADSSATGMIMWGVLKAKEAGHAGSVDDGTVKAIAEACLRFFGDDGIVYGCSGPSGGFGSYSENYNENNGWGQGGILSFYAALVKYLENTAL